MRTLSVCRVLSLSRQDYLSLAAAYPLSAKTMMDNLLRAAQEVGGP